MTNNIGSDKKLQELKRAVAVFAAVLLAALALGLALMAAPAGAAPGVPCSTCEGGGGGSGDTIAPTVTGVSPAADATGVPSSENVTATFSEDMDATTITTSTFTLVKNGTTTPVAAVVNYDSPSKTATLNPDANLDSLATYTATVTSGAKDLAGNGLDQDSSTAGAQPKTWSFTVQDYTAPSVSANNASVAVDEGQTAANSGTYSDNASGDVAITASRGTVTKTGTNSGTWSWSYATNDGPAQGGSVTITARDQSGNFSTTSFSLNVKNVAPTATFNAPQSSYAGKTFVVSLTDPIDPSSWDANVGFTYAFDCGSGYGVFGTSSVASCQAGSAGTSKTVKGKIRDKDGGVMEYTRTVTVNPAPPSYPNGRIAFESDRDGNREIYTANADGSELRRLTNNTASDTDPAYSLDGKKIGFGRYGDIWVMNANGTGQTRLTSHSTLDSLPAFSPDGSKIAFMSRRDGNEEIYIMNADGTGQTRLTSHAAQDSYPAFSPDGSKMAFEGDRDGNYEIYAMNADGTGVTRLTNNATPDLDPSWGGAGDTTPPETTIASGPSGSVNSTSASFSFSSEPDSIFECKLDGGAFERCESHKAYSNLSEGEHTFQVRAIDASLNTDPTPASRTWTMDLTAPSVTGRSPSNGTQGIAEGTNVTITFSESMDASTLNETTFTLAKQGNTTPVAAAVSYDAANNTATLNPAADLDSTATYVATVKGGSSGAKDAAGNPLTSDETWSFATSDTRSPSVSLTAPVDGATVGGTVQLTAEATDNVAVDRVEFLVNGSAVGSDATAPYVVNWNSTTFNSDGARITARAIDTSNNEATSTAHTVTVDNIPPETTLDPSGPSGTVTSTSASFAFSSEAGATFECKLDASAFEPCASPKSYTALANGSHTFEVRAKDAAGNVDANPASRTWTVDTAGPSGTISINGGAAYTKSATVNLALSASDPAPNSGVAGMRFSNDGVTWSNWEAFATNKSWMLSSVNGTKTVRVQYRDGAGNVSTVQDTIILDTIKPAISGMSPKPGTTITDTTPAIKATVRDNLTNLQKANIKLYLNGVLISPTKYSYSAATDVLIYNSPQLPKGKKTVKIVATDAARNVGAKSWSFTIN